ncbi:hypothetical protein [Chryseobacterium turcicum]|uniref:Zf-HC2 domain-containing protein n=1 Tax=Chryseobacterium turcicum TaxID=2898076 RepID=A0A9Q3V4I4_9FLAO|nr:hypothetical protein [Chryseobacterium turcicum]MCD1117916.1 hypothetical protein [Chryseobacterium turcicum]
MFRKIIHIFFLPCSTATLLLEKRNANNISQKENWQLSMHLKICKWCKAYEEKLKILDSLLKKRLSKEDENILNESEIQDFKNKILKKIDF